MIAIACNVLRAGQRITLARDVPQQYLSRGQAGIVCSHWFDPSPVYEVEFVSDLTGEAVRVLLSPDDIVDDGSPVALVEDESMLVY
jgi:hypothetical protein